MDDLTPQERAQVARYRAFVAAANRYQKDIASGVEEQTAWARKMDAWKEADRVFRDTVGVWFCIPE